MKPSKRRMLRAFLLAVLCIAAMELWFCSYADPELFDRVTSPVLRAAETAQGQVKGRLLALSQALFQQEIEEEAVAVAEGHGQKDAPAVNSAVTEFRTQDGHSILTGGNVPLIYYNQKDEEWAECLFGKDPMGKYGCGPTTMAMVVSSMTGHDLNPAEMGAWAAKQGYSAPKSGSYLSIVRGTAKAFGLECTPLTDRTAQELRLHLASGGVVVALMGRGSFTQTGHFILLRGMTLSGEILIADSNSRENSLQLWQAQDLLDELSGSRGSGAPLWLITAGPVA